MMGPRCFECGASADHEHHVIPQSIGGTRTVSLCEDCHGKVHGRDLRIRTLTKRALDAKRAKGERTGEVPYGYSAGPDGRLVPNEGEQRVIALVRRYRAAGMPLRAIVAELARAGFKSRGSCPLGLTQVARLARVARDTSDPTLL
jgi:hypothetical protein